MVVLEQPRSVLAPNSEESTPSNFPPHIPAPGLTLTCSFVGVSSKLPIQLVGLGVNDFLLKFNTVLHHKFQSASTRVCLWLDIQIQTRA